MERKRARNKSVVLLRKRKQSTEPKQRLSETAPGTAAFFEYVVMELWKRGPFKSGDCPRIPVQRGGTPFPEFILNVLGGDYDTKIEDKIDEADDDIGLIFTEIAQYLNRAFKGSVSTRIPLLEKPYPLTFSIPIAIINPKYITNLAHELEIDADGKPHTVSGTGASSFRHLMQIDYNSSSGTGHTNGEPFKFKNDQPEFAVFAELHANLNNAVERKQVLALCGLQETDTGGLKLLDPSKTRKKSDMTNATNYLTKLASKMRKRAHLTPEQLINNNGDLTLVVVRSTARIKFI